MDGSPISESTVQITGNGTGVLSFSEATSLSAGPHAFTMEIACPNNPGMFLGFIQPTLPVNTRTLSVLDLGS